MRDSGLEFPNEEQNDQPDSKKLPFPATSVSLHTLNIRIRAELEQQGHPRQEMEGWATMG